MAAAQGPAPLAGRTVVVTGTSSGIGLATANVVAAAGATVHGLSRRPGTGDFTSHHCDVTQPEAVTEVIDQIAAVGGLDGVVIAAGTNVAHRRLDLLTVDDWHLLVDTNLSGAFHVLHACLPHLRRRGGDAVLISSVSGVWPDVVAGAAYQASKAGLVALGRAAALEERHHSVRVSTILPGIVNTAILDRRPEPPPAERREAALQPVDVAEICAFLLALPRHAYIPELTVLPTALQALGDT